MKQDCRIALRQTAYDIVDGYETETNEDLRSWAYNRHMP